MADPPPQPPKPPTNPPAIPAARVDISGTDARSTGTGTDTGTAESQTNAGTNTGETAGSQTNDAAPPHPGATLQPAAPADANTPPVAGNATPDAGSRPAQHGQKPAPTKLDGTSREFLEAQVEALEPLQFLIVGSPSAPFNPMEIARDEQGCIVVRLPPRISGEPLDVPLRTKLVERGFSSADPASAIEPWEHPVAGDQAVDSAIDLALDTLREILGVELAGALDIAHGSHKDEVDTKRRLQVVRDTIEPVLAELLGHAPDKDRDGDYVCVVEGVKVFVAPRALLGAPIVLRVFAITNIGVNIEPELGLFLARLNFGLTFGRFALDAEHRAIWFDETLLGEHTTNEELTFTVNVVAGTAKEWADRIKANFGGITQEAMAEPAQEKERVRKPGEGGYL